MDYNKNYYQELGLDKNCNQEDIKKAYRKLAHKYHPDKNQGNKDYEAKFQRINEANSILSDSNTKKEYDQRSPHGNSYSPHNQFGGFEFNFGGGMDDILRQFFGGRNPFGGFYNEEFRENLDVNLSVNINLKQIYLDEPIEIKYNKYTHCDDCKGTGFDRSSKSDVCEMCNGTGRNKGTTCEYCQGDGKVYIGQCKKCKGEKVIMKETNINLQYLSQLRNNIRNAHPGYGHQSKYYRDKTGNLILNINILRNDDYQIINNYELNKTIDVHFQDAIDGNEILFTHIDDSIIKIKLPKKSKNNDIIRIKEKGLLKNDNIRADLYLKINIIIDYERV
jgi:molecular chaperone DnaJ